LFPAVFGPSASRSYALALRFRNAFAIFPASFVAFSLHSCGSVLVDVPIAHDAIHVRCAVQSVYVFDLGTVAVGYPFTIIVSNESVIRSEFDTVGTIKTADSPEGVLYEDVAITT